MLPGKSAHGNGGKIPYYEHGWALKRQAMLNKKVFHCDPHRVNAKRIEGVIWNDCLEVLANPETGQRLVAQAKTLFERADARREIEKLEQKAQAYADQIEALAEHLAKIQKGVSPAPIFAQMQKMEELKQETIKEREQRLSEQGVQELPASWSDFENYVKLIREALPVIATPETRSKIIALLVQKIEVFPSRVRLHYFVGENRIQALRPEILRTAAPNPINDIKKTEEGIAPNPGSSNLTNGRGDEFRTPAPLLPII